jgi:hypothetical protein
VRRAQRPADAVRPTTVPRALAPSERDAALAEIAPSLPPDHPAWQRDVLAVSARVRALVGAMAPIVVRVLTFWDHALYAIAIGSRRVEIDPSGCYRLS